jgi:hypothetical protein
MTIVSMKPSKPPPGARDGTEARVADYPAPVTDAEVVLTGSDLTVAEVEAVARRGAAVSIHPDARARMERSRAVIEQSWPRTPSSTA